MNSNKKYTLITGASSGIGLELARIFATTGHNLILVARNKKRLERLKSYLKNKHNIDVCVCIADLSTSDGYKEICQYTELNNLSVDILVNNAGFGDYGEFSKSNLNKQVDMIEVNVTSLVELTHYYLKNMLENNYGKILNLASIASFQAGPLMSVYYGTKAFVLSFTEALSVELRNTNITVTALCPGPTESGFKTTANMNRSGAFKNFKNASAKEVAIYGYKKLMKGKVIAIPGALNKVLIQFNRIIPRSIVSRIVLELQK